MTEFRFLIGPEIIEAEQSIPDDQKISWPLDSIVLFAYEDGKVVGRIGIMAIKIVEGTYADPSKRGGRLPLELMKRMEAMQAYLGEPNINAPVYDEQAEVADYLTRVGFERVPLTLYTKLLLKETP